MKVLTPANTWAPVVTTPEAVAEAEGIAANEISDAPLIVNFPVGPAAPPSVHENAVG